jgi:hypothetical protein
VRAYNRFIMFRTAALFLLAAPLAAQDRARITVTTIDRTFTVKRLEIAETAGDLTLTSVDDAGSSSTIKCLDVVEIGFAPVAVKSAPGPDDVEVLLRTGDRIAGALGAAEKDAVRVAAGSLGEIVVPFTRIDQVRFTARRADWPKETPKITRDTLWTASGDRPMGTVLSVGRGEIVYLHARRNQEVKLPTKDATVILFMPIPPDPPPPPKSLYSMVQLTDGSELRGKLRGLGSGGLSFTDLYGDERTVPASGLAGVYFKNGRVIYLSDLEPAKVDENANYLRAPEPMPGDLSFPWQRDANAGDGGRLRIRGTEFRKGIGVHARSALTFALDGGFSRFQATVGIDDYAGRLSGLDPAGNVSFAVIADGAVLERRDGVTSRTAPIALSLDVRGRKELTLLVDFGEDRSGQCDFADWALARVIR